MAPEVKEEAPALPKAEARAKDLKAKKAELKGVHGHTQRRLHVTHLPEAQGTAALKAACVSREGTPGDTSLATTLSPRSPSYRVSHGEDRRHPHTVRCGCQGQQAPDQTRRAEKRLHDIDVAKVSP